MPSTDRNAVTTQYSELAPRYDQRWSFYIEATVRETLRRLELQPGESLLDVGCGTGVLLEALSASIPDAQLAGVDPSSKMLEVARKRLGEVVLLKESPAESLPFPDEGFDVVVSTNAFHYYRNPRGALEEMARVLCPGGRIVITDWCDDYVACRLCDFWLRVFDRAHFRTYGKKQCGRFLQQAGFTGIRIDRYKINWLWGLMTAVGQKYAAQQGDAPDDASRRRGSPSR